MPRVLIVEDDTTLLRVVSDNFASRSYEVETALDGEIAIEKATRCSLDLIILDVMLPKVNGYEVCRYLRQQEVKTPIIFLTAKDEESDILLGLGLGADDYLAKPFSIRELLARAEAVLRRSEAMNGSSPDHTVVQFGKFQLDFAARKLRGEDNQSIKLSPREYELLAFLIRHEGEARSREQIMDSVWGFGARVASRSIDRFVTTLRKKIESRPGEFIETIREYGYRFRKLP